MLDSVGMVWGSKYDNEWEKAYRELCRYKHKFGDTEVPVKYESGGIKLEKWTRRQRDKKRAFPPIE